MTLVADAYGDPGDPPVLLAHGGGQTRHAWGDTAARLAQAGWYAIAYDHRGHGESDRAVDQSYALDTFAHDICDVIAALDQRPVVIGASLGGLAGLLAEGELVPGSLAGLVLVDITPRMEPAGVGRIVGFMLEHIEEGFASLEEAADAVAAYQPQRDRPVTAAGLAKNLRLDPDGRWRWHWDPDMFMGPTPLGAPMTSRGRLDLAAENLSCPVLLVRGRVSDLCSVETAQEFLAAVPHAAYADVSGAGHMVAGDRNDIFTEAILSWLLSLR